LNHRVTEDTEKREKRKDEIGNGEGLNHRVTEDTEKIDKREKE